MISNTEVIRMMQVTSSNEGADGDGRGGDDSLMKMIMAKGSKAHRSLCQTGFSAPQFNAFRPKNHTTSCFRAKKTCCFVAVAFPSDA